MPRLRVTRHGETWYERELGLTNSEKKEAARRSAQRVRDAMDKPGFFEKLAKTGEQQ